MAVAQKDRPRQQYDRRTILNSHAMLQMATFALFTIDFLLVAGGIINAVSSAGSKLPPLGASATATPTSVLQPYFDVMHEDAKNHKGECDVDSDCLSPNVCDIVQEGDESIGSCVAPALLSPSLAPVRVTPVR
jgi:hypothetical protein